MNASIAVAGLGLVVALALIAVVFNNLLARLAWLEVGLANGLVPPTDATTAVALTDGPPGFNPALAAERLDNNAVHVLLSSHCSTCVRLADELSDPEIDLGRPMHLWFEGDAPGYVTAGNLHERARDLIADVAAPVTPYVITIDNSSVAAHGGAGTLEQVTALVESANANGIALR